MIYITNKVLIPRLEYRLKTTIWEDNVYEDLFRPIYAAIKRKLRLPRNAHNNILLYSAIGNVRNLWRNQIAAHITEFYIALNSHDRLALSMKIRLQTAQLRLNLTDSILTASPSIFHYFKLRDNYSYTTLRKAKLYLFNFTCETLKEDWKIDIYGPTIRDFVT